jgi:Zn-dependent peptidase ImmA (M78 family)/transcriptional regulator with XRE-family HTH domain
MSLGVDNFTASRLVLARERRGLTQRKLSELVGVSDRMIKAYEAGEKNPAPETLGTLARELKFPLAFFEAPHVEQLQLEAASFRALSKASAALRHRTVAAGTIALELHRYLAERFDLPTPDVPDVRAASTPSKAAEMVRHQWGLGQKPISNVVHLLELHGIAVFSLSEDCESIDAFSIWNGGTPFVFLNNRKTPERSIFDAAHELGHLVLHRHGTPQGRKAEVEADEFASSFLMPESAIRATAPRMVTIASLAAMKSTWKVSVAALGYRMHDLGLISDWHYKHFNIELSRRGRSNEPAPLPRETSAVIRKSLAVLAEEGVTLREIARELRLPVAELQALAFGLGVVEGDGTSLSPRRGPLHLVK